MTVTLPPSGDRYLSLALIDAYTNNFAILGTRTTGTNGITFSLVGPNDAARGGNIVRAPTRHVWALGRTLVNGPPDLEAARQVQSGISMRGPAADPYPPCATRGDAWPAFFASVARLMADNPPPVTDRAILEVMAPLGLDDFDPSRFSSAQAAEIEAGIALARVDAQNNSLESGGFIQGWSYPSAHLGNFGQDYEYRAGVAIGALAALPPVEAMYMRAEGNLPGALFDGGMSWRLSFPADRPVPVRSFWSLCLYEATDDGNFFFTENPLGRYSIGDRTPGLTTDGDGSLDIWIGHENPGPGMVSNWLPAPPGPFALIMRAFLPKPGLLEGRYRLPPVSRV